MKKKSRDLCGKLRLHRETLRRLDLRKEDYAKVAGGTVLVYSPCTCSELEDLCPTSPACPPGG